MKKTEGMTKAEEQAAKLTEAAQDLTEKARSSVKEVGEAADLYVHDHTWTTLLLAAVAACTVGYLIGRRS